MDDHAVLVSDQTISYDLIGGEIDAAIESTPSLLEGMGERLLFVNGSVVRMMDGELAVERVWNYKNDIRYVHAEDVWGNDRHEVVVLEGDNVHIRYGSGWRVDWTISDVVGDASGADADFGEWDGDDDTVELFVVTDDGQVLWVSIHIGGLSATEELALLLSPQNIVVAALAAALTGLLLVYPEWYVLDTVGVMVSAGVASLFGISFGLLPAIVLLGGLMAYDAFAVYQSKHMIDLADEAVSQHLPLLLVIPKDEGYSYLDQGSIKEQIDRGEERDAMFLGMGDLIIPTVLVVSAYRWLDPDVTVAGVGGNLVVALATMFGILAGFAFLAVQVAKGKPHAGLPFLNSGALAAYFAAALAVYGSLGF
ncbi:MAG: hypothetical protein L0Z54_00075 [Thermoplasmata archaeon]|nr:hypothetical protein [Thermoplasmata archaeon]